jgi:hypothetical protein
VTLTLEALDTVMAAQRSSGKQLVPHNQSATAPVESKLLRLVKEGLIGPPQAVRVRNKGNCGGYEIIHQGCHTLALISMSFPEAGLFPVPALTVNQVLSAAAALQRGEKILIHGAGGITGGVLVAVAAEMGGWVIATAGPASAERVRGYGASEVLDYHQAAWPTAAAWRRLPATPRPASVTSRSATHTCARTGSS